MEKELTYTIEDDAIAELFGRQNFSTEESAIFELVKNCYDSGAKNCEVVLEKDRISIIDDGDGMNQTAIEYQWMHVGKSNKGYIDTKHNRVLAGSKGVGRFALARLGNNVELFTNPVDGDAVKWVTNWKKSYLYGTEYSDKGTKIVIENLRKEVKRKDVDKLINFLCRSYNSHGMNLSVKWESKVHEITPIYEKLALGVDFTTKINLKYLSDDCQLSVEVINDEFREDVLPIVAPISATYYSQKVDIFEEFSTAEQTELEKYELKQMLQHLGTFDAEFYFGVQSKVKANAERFHYKYDALSKINSFGVILYRNSFSISSYEGTKDWLAIESRARKSPAAATHPSGSWRIRYNQIDGFVTIDKKENEVLVDLSNRQGLEENEYYTNFIAIITTGIGVFERYRQSIIRKIEKNNKETAPKKNKTSKSLSNFLKQPEKAEKMSKEQLQEIATDIQNMQKKQREEQKEKKQFEKKIAYENRILNVLATQGLRASSVAHEYHTKNNAIGSSTQYIIDALKYYGYWDDLNSPEKIKKQYRNVPALLSQGEEINLVIGRFMETMLKKIEKKSFSVPISSIEQAMNVIINAWRQEYSWIKIKCDITDLSPKHNNLYNDLLTVIFDNLILNSIQHNEDVIPLSISIKINYDGKKFVVEYSDNGHGLSPKYIKNPRRILEVHETSRTDGHGLGMWMIYTSLLRNNGEVIDIIGNDGFKINFYFGE